MVKKITIIWVLVLITFVPYAIYYLLFVASRSEYAILILFILFWIFGFWGVAGPIIAIVKARKIFISIKQVKSVEELKMIVQRSEAREIAVDLIASENHIPKFIARRVYNLILKSFSKTGQTVSEPARIEQINIQ